jgi:isoleucyl-tRNA synthetase
MSEKFPEYKNLDLSQINKDVLEKWEAEKTFEESLESRKENPSFVFFEGPPSANGMPGIHHVMARTIKDVVCRYKTLKGFHVDRKAGWDTHGLPVELGVEKKLGITKEDIGGKVSVDDYNSACRSEVMTYTKEWEDLTHKMGYWVNMEDPYITYDNKYIETLWALLKRLFDKGLIYKGYTIQPFSPAAGTGLSTHELNQPGCYKDVKDTTCVAQFTVVNNEKSSFLFSEQDEEVAFLAWTTTPWTLPSNTALAVGPGIKYIKVRSFNPYTNKKGTFIIAKDRQAAFFNPKAAELSMADYKAGDKLIPFEVVEEFKGTDLAGIVYEQLMPFIKPDGKAFEVITGDFVTTEDGTGVVHIAPTFGADDDRVAKMAGIAPLILIDDEGNRQPMVDRQGRFYRIEKLDADFIANNVDVELYKEWSGRFVKNAYDKDTTDDTPTLDVDISVMLKMTNKAFKVEKHIHNYPHCWRTDKPILYYPLDSWFIKTTNVKDRMIELNKTINWKPKSTGEGRFGKWLENLVDWNLSRSRYWGTPLPIWATEDRTGIKCIGSVEELMGEIEKSIAAGFMTENPYAEFVSGDFSKENYAKIDLHRPYVDGIILVADDGQKMVRELDLIDVWFDSGAMPYAQVHYPFENKELIDEGKKFPADFIAEGVDQTRGWFFTLHALGTMLFDSVAFKNIISNGLVLDSNGNKMSKRLGNGVDPFGAIEQYGSDPVRWYMTTNSQPWDNLKFDINGVEEVKRKFFGTLYNTYSFFTLYANIDKFDYSQPDVPMNERPEIDKWVLSILNTLTKEVQEAYETFEPTRAGRAIQNFVSENLSNWFVRLSRRRYWGGEFTTDKLSAYQTLYKCLETVSVLMSPIAPFFADRLFRDLNAVTGRFDVQSVHLADFPTIDEAAIDKGLEERMNMAQSISSMVLGLRRKVKLRVRQPLAKIIIPILDTTTEKQIEAIKDIILSEINVKEIEYITDTSGILVKSIKADFKKLGRKFGKQMKLVASIISDMSQTDISDLEKNGTFYIDLEGVATPIDVTEVDIISEDIPGWLVANEGRLTVALDINITEELKEEGIARELINRIQNARKEIDFEVTDKINLTIGKHAEINAAVEKNKEYISTQVLAQSLEMSSELNEDNARLVEIDDITTYISIEKA